jgi:hypothetical protein
VGAGRAADPTASSGHPRANRAATNRVEPAEVRLDAYLAEWIEGRRLETSTLSSYRKNIRLHIDP